MIKKLRGAELDEAIIAALRDHGAMATYVIRNWASPRSADLTTASVLRRCKRLEHLGYVERAPTSYLVMISWRLKRREATAT
ncbi:MAG: hypothetical protein ABSF67_02950 [Roseiarcus sp.]|jgi:DNA-binding IclR family transcriptional regulator